MIRNKQNEKITAQAFAKQALAEHLENFVLGNAEGYDDLVRTEPAKVGAFVDKIMPRLKKIVAIKE